MTTYHYITAEPMHHFVIICAGLEFASSSMLPRGGYAPERER